MQIRRRRTVRFLSRRTRNHALREAGWPRLMTPSIFGTCLREVRKLRGWTQHRLARESDIPAAVISHFETGTRQRASAANLVKLASALSVSVDYLLGRTEAIDLREDRVQAIFRRLSSASAQTIDQAVRLIEVLLDQESQEGGKGQ